MKKYKINLHSHTRYSDGGYTILEQTKKFKEAGFCCNVITDHVYEHMDLFSVRRDKFESQLLEAEQVSKELDFPIIVGIELRLLKVEEMLLFGHEAIREVLKLTDSKKLGVDNLKEILANYKTATILAHPSMRGDFYNLKIWELLDGFELYNSGCPFFKNSSIPVELQRLRAFSNSDDHDLRKYKDDYNYFSEKITNEDELINYITSGKPVEMYSKWIWDEEDKNIIEVDGKKIIRIVKS